MRPQRKVNAHLPTQQAGVTTILAVLMMLSLLTFLAVVTDTGRLYLEKRTLQKNADLAAMETALIYCRDQTLDVESLTLDDMLVLSATRNDFKGDATNSSLIVTRDGNAITVNLSHKVPTSLFAQLLPTGDNETNLSAQATAKACEPTAQLTIRNNTALSVDSSESALLNAVLGGLLGTTLSLDVGDWNGLLNTNINLLSYLDLLAIDLGIADGEYDTVLATNVELADLLRVAADVLSLETGSEVAIDALSAIESTIPIPIPPIKLGDLIVVQPESDESALDVGIKLMELVQGSIQLANSKTAIAATIDSSLLGLANVLIQLKVSEPPQISAIGNPENAQADPLGPNKIYVRSAQIRAFVSFVTTLPGISNVIPARLDILINISNAEAYVTDYRCDNGTKELGANSATSLATIKLGSLGATQAAAATNAFASDDPTVNSTQIVNVLGLVGIGVSLDADLLDSGTLELDYENSPDEDYLPEVRDVVTDNAYKSVSAENILSNLSGALSDFNLDITGTVSIVLAPIVNPIISLLTSTLDTILLSVLSPVLDPILNNLLTLLGVDIAEADIGAALTCENDKVRLIN
jgi:uncharacterized membrane protein